MNLSQLYRVGFCVAAFLFVLALLQHFFLPGSDGKLVMQLQRESMLEFFAVSGVRRVNNAAVPTGLFCST